MGCGVPPGTQLGCVAEGGKVGFSERKSTKGREAVTQEVSKELGNRCWGVLAVGGVHSNHLGSFMAPSALQIFFLFSLTLKNTSCWAKKAIRTYFERDTVVKR